MGGVGKRHCSFKIQLAMNTKIGIPGLLGLLFVTLKLLHVIDWSWWWVVAPFWGPAAVGAVVLAIVGIGALVVVLYEKIE